MDGLLNNFGWKLSLYPQEFIAKEKSLIALKLQEIFTNITKCANIFETDFSDNQTHHQKRKIISCIKIAEDNYENYKVCSNFWNRL